jgi:hypothetical protein
MIIPSLIRFKDFGLQLTLQAQYAIRNLVSSKSIVSQDGRVDVSLTSHGRRIKTAHLVIESIAQGSELPKSITLWLDEKAAFENPTSEIRRLVKRGLELRLCSNYGPHTKYFPHVFFKASALPLVTADDDIFYPRWWLARLVEQGLKGDRTIVCHRAHRIAMEKLAIAPYRRWTSCTTTEPSMLNFATGVSGVFYPNEFLVALKGEGEGFAKVCPKADDVWLHAVAVRNDFSIAQTAAQPIHFPVLRGSQTDGLMVNNVFGKMNDLQVAATYGAAELAKLSACWQALVHHETADAIPSER